MFYGKMVKGKKGSGFVLLLLLVMAALECSKPAPDLPKDLFGIRIGMSRDAAQKRLTETADFERDEEKSQQVWRLKSDARFNKLAVGYDRENRVRYITAFVDKATARERVRFSEVGDLSRAKKEILEPHRRYIWETAGAAAADDDETEKDDERGAPYIVNIYGDEPEFLTIYTLSKKYVPGESDEEGERGGGR